MTKRFGIISAVLLMTMLTGTASAQSNPSAPQLNLADAGALPYKMQMHGTALIGDRMYVFGGDLAGGSNATLWTSKVQSAPVDPSTFKVGQWREEEPMPDMRSYLTNCVEVVNDRIYIVGGNVATKPDVELSTARTNTIAWTKVSPDGKLEKWRTSQPYPGEPVILTATCSTDDSLLLLGGMYSQPSSKIYAATFTSDGQPTDWKEIGSLPTTLFNHGACIQDGRIYTWGGLTAMGRPNSRVYSAAYDNGTIGMWRDEEPMPTAIYGASSCGINDYLVAIGGRYGASVPTNDIWFARINDGHVSKWQQVRTNMEATVYHTLGLEENNGIVFITGGQIKKSATDLDGGIVARVQAFKIPSADDHSIAAGLPNMDAALARARAEKKNALVYFYSPAVPACKRVWEESLSKPEFKSLAGDKVLGAVNTAQKDSTWSYKLGVFRVPCLVEVTPEGKAVRRSGGLRSAEDVNAFLAKK